MGRALLAIGVLVAAAGAGAVVACGGDSSNVGPPADGGVEGSSIVDATTDTSVLEDAGEITDGGANIDPDADLGGDDAGPDGAPCNTIVNEAPAVASACISVLPVFEGGPIEPGKYYLTAVSAIGNKNFCKMTFLPVGFRETMEVAVDGAGTATAEVAAQVAGGILRHSTVTFAPRPANTSPATGQSICPPRAAGDVAYTSRTNPGGTKHILGILLPYGAGIAIYRFESQ